RWLCTGAASARASTNASPGPTRTPTPTKPPPPPPTASSLSAGSAAVMPAVHDQARPDAGIRHHAPDRMAIDERGADDHLARVGPRREAAERRVAAADRRRRPGEGAVDDDGESLPPHRRPRLDGDHVARRELGPGVGKRRADPHRQQEDEEGHLPRE